MRNGVPAAARLTLVCVLGALLLAPAAAADIRVGAADDHPKASPEVAARFYDAMKDVGLTENRITLLWDSAHPTTINGQDNLAGGDPGRAGRRSPHHAGHLSGAREGAHRVARRPRQVRRLRSTRRADVPDGQGLHHRQRAEQVAVLAAAVQPERHPRRLRRLRVGARCLLRRAQVGRPLDHRDRGRPGPARDRQPVRPGEPLDLAGPLHRTTWAAVPQQQTEEADHGRAQLPPVPERVHGQARRRLRVAERGHPGPRPDQAGRLGRVPRHRSADVRGGRHAVRPRAHAQAAAERGRLAGLDPTRESRGLLRQGERRHDRRGDAGGDLREPDPAAWPATRPSSRCSSSTSSTRRTSTAGSPG